MDFYRYHGLGNDYLVIDPNKTTLRITTESVRAICRPHFGEGSDGLLYGPLFTDNGEIQLRIFIPMAVKRRKVEMERGFSLDIWWMKDTEIVSKRLDFKLSAAWCMPR